MMAAWTHWLAQAAATGAVVTLFVLLLEKIAASRVPASIWRAAWLLAALAFLLPGQWKIAILPAASPRAEDPSVAMTSVDPAPAPWGLDAAGAFDISGWLLAPWLAGVCVVTVLVAVRTILAAREWRGCAFSTDSRLLDIFEECRLKARCPTPVGLVVSDRVKTPAVLGWLHPRLLLPASQLSPAQLRHVFHHELAHIRSADLAWGGLMTLAVALQWFNPFVHLAARRWRTVREESADELALRLGDFPTGESYAETLVHLLKAGRLDRPLGTLGISETAAKLQQRIRMIQLHPRKTLPRIIPFLGLALLASALFLRPVAAEPTEADQKSAAAAAMEKWLKVMDAGDFAASWKDASAPFKKAAAEDLWVAVSKQVRTPLGACQSRELASITLQNEIPQPSGEPLKGSFALAQFKTSFENLFRSVETVCFEREKDGQWRASGYYIKPD